MKIQFTLRAVGSALLVAGLSACGGGGSSSKGGESAAVDPDPVAEPAADEGPAAGGTQNPAVADTSVVLSGALNLTGASSSSSASLALTAASEVYYMKAVTLSLSDLTSCVTEVATDGSWKMTCPGFKGKKLGIFVLKGAAGNAESADLDIVAMITSDDLALNEESTDAEVVVELDASTGATSVQVTQKKVQRDASGRVVAEETKEAAPIEIAPELVNFSVSSGVYDFQFCDTDRNRAAKGEMTAANCENLGTESFQGHREQMYIDFKAASGTTRPQLALWRSKADRDKCYVGGDLAYSISDGTNTLSITADTTFQQVYSAVVGHGWIPQMAIDTAQVLSQLEDKAKGGGKADETQFFKTALGVADDTQICSKLIGELGRAAYDGARIEKGQCDPSSIQVTAFGAEETMQDPESGAQVSKNVVFSQMLQGRDGPPIEWCSDYRHAKLESTQAADDAIGRFITECDLHFSGEDLGSQVWQRREVVDAFFRFLSESRHESGGDARFDGFKEAYAAVNLADLANESDENLIALAQQWRAVNWEWAVNRVLDVVLLNVGEFSTAIEGLSNSGSISPRDYFISLLRNDQARENLEQQACKGDGRVDLNVPAIYATGAAGDVLLSRIELRPDGEGYQLTSAAETAIGGADPAKTALSEFVYGVTGGVDETDANSQHVKGCSSVQLRQQLQWANNGQEVCEDLMVPSTCRSPAEQQIEHLGHSLRDGKRGYIISSITLGDPNGDGTKGALADPDTQAGADAIALDRAKLLSDAKALFESAPEWSGWMFAGGICKLEQSYSITLGNDTILCAEVATEEARQSKMESLSQGSPARRMLENAHAPEGFSLQNDKEELIHLTHMLSGMLAHEASRYDTSFKDTKRALLASSQCLPDVRLGHDFRAPEGQAVTIGNVQFPLHVNGPVKRRMSGAVDLAVAFDAPADATARFRAEDSRLEKHRDMSRECVWGEVQRLDKMYLDASVLRGTFSQAWVNRCTEFGGDDSAQESGEESGDQQQSQDPGWFAIFAAQPL